MIEQFEKLLAQGQDNALLRFSLGNAYLQQGDAEQAVVHLRLALEHDKAYSAAWRSLGQALSAANQLDEALSVYEKGIATAEEKGDKQAVKEMQVFAKRLRKTIASS